MKEFYVEAAARLIGVSKKTLQRWDRMGKVTATRSANGYRVYTLEAIELAKKFVASEIKSVDTPVMGYPATGKPADARMRPNVIECGSDLEVEVEI